MLERADKRYILKRILDEVLDGNPGNHHLATLGGEGLEAELWEAKGLKHRNGWLIEASPTRGGRLIKKSRYMLFEGRLEKFRAIFETQEGLKTGLRMFHWDLCGTVEPNIKDLERVLPLLERSKVSTLVVTMADARANLALLRPNEAEQRIKRMFRHTSSQIFKALTELYSNGEKPRPTVTREISAVGLIFELMRHLEPVRMDRFFYVSLGMRMRTYAFHLKRKPDSVKLSDLRHRQTQVWLSSQVHWVKDGETNGMPSFVHPAGIKQKGEVMTMDVVPVSEQRSELKQIRERLAPVIVLLSAEVRADVERLLVLSETPKFDEEALVESVTKKVMLKIFDNLVGRVTVAQPKPSIQPGKDSVMPKNGKNGMQTRSHAAHKFSDLDLAEKDTLRLELIVAASKGEKAFEKKREDIINKYGLNRAKTRNKQIGMMKAKGMGEHRPEFVARMISRAQSPDAKNAMYADLATAYGCPVAELEAEVDHYTSKSAKAARSAKAKKAALH